MYWWVACFSDFERSIWFIWYAVAVEKNKIKRNKNYSSGNPCVETLNQQHWPVFIPGASSSQEVKELKIPVHQIDRKREKSTPNKGEREREREEEKDGSHVKMLSKFCGNNWKTGSPLERFNLQSKSYLKQSYDTFA